MLQHAPAGPLRKLLIELLPHSEARSQRERGRESEKCPERAPGLFVQANGAVMDSPISKAREMCARLVASSLFEFFSGFVILLQLGTSQLLYLMQGIGKAAPYFLWLFEQRNLVAIGVEAEMSLQETRWPSSNLL